MTTLASANFNDALPAAPSGRKNVKWQADSPTTDPRNISAYVSNIGTVDARTTVTETIALAALGKLVTFDNAGSVAVTLDSTVPVDFFCFVEDLGVGTATLTPSSGTINGAANLPLTSGSGGVLFFDGTNWKAVTGGGGAGGFSNGTLGIVIDGAGSVPGTGSKGFVQAPYDCTIVSWTMLANASGSAQITVKKSTYAGFPTTSSIVAAAPPNLSSAQKNASSTLTGWTTAISKGDVLEFNLDSIATITRVLLQLQITRSD